MRPALQAAVLNLDDPFGLRLAERLAARGVRTIGYGLAHAMAARDAADEFVVARDLRVEGGITHALLQSSWGEAGATINQIGHFNVANALGVLGCLVAHGMPFRDAAALLAELPPVPGRMQKIAEQPGRPLVVVDYAHTPDALDKAARALQPVAHSRGGRLVVVFGAGGDRDADKRPLDGRDRLHGSPIAWCSPPTTRAARIRRRSSRRYAGACPATASPNPTAQTPSIPPSRRRPRPTWC